MTPDHSQIPQGHYCYTIINIEYGPKTEVTKKMAELFGEEDRGEVTLRTKVCPYWGRDEAHPYGENGYCTLTGKKDWVDGGLLWDQVKECGINMEGD